jgi:hypothetical protein
MADWTQADIDTLRAAIATGILSVEYSGPPARRVQYQSLAAMRDLLAEMVADVGTAAGTRRAIRYFKTDKGF